MSEWISKNRILIWMLLGLMFGNIVGDCLTEVSFLSCMGYGYTFGMTEPFVLELGALVISFGIKIYINVNGVIGMMIALIIYKSGRFDSIK